MNTGTVMWMAHSAIERRSNSDGSRPGPGAGRHHLRSRPGTIEALRLTVEGLVGQAGRRGTAGGGQFGVDLVVDPRLADLRHRGGRQRRPGGRRRSCGRRLGVVDPLADPAGGEPVVVDAAGVAGGEQVVGRAHRRDGRQPGRVGARGGQLGQPRVADADHADLVVGHPVLVGHDLDGVVGVVVGRVAEEVEGAARAAGAAHLEADRGEAGQPGQHGAHVGRAVGQQIRVAAVRARGPEGLGEEGGDRIGGPRRVVPRVLDHGGAGRSGAARAAVGVPDGGRQLDAVAHGEVVQPLVHGLIGVEGRVGGRVGPGGEHREGWCVCRSWCRARRTRIPGSGSG